MSIPRLPPEILDHIADILHDEPEALKECCLVSKSWVPRTQKHLFANIELRSEGDLESWKKAFPDPSNSPAHHTHTLKIGGTQVIRAADVGEGGWIQAFSRVASLDLSGDVHQYPDDPVAPLAPFYKFSPTLKSLRVRSSSLSYPELFTLVRSSPLLEDLTLAGHGALLKNGDDPDGSQAVVPSVPPALTGTLNLVIHGGMEYTTRQLLDLPNGLHFRKLMFSWFEEEDLEWIMKLVNECSDSLEHLNVDRFGAFLLILGWGCGLPSPAGDPSPASLDLSNAKKLGGVTFWSISVKVEWITTALQTITPEHREFRLITIHVPYGLVLFKVGDDIRQAVGETIHQGWLDLDRLLVRLWESNSIRPRVECDGRGEEEQSLNYCIGCLLPEITRRGIIDLF